MTGDPGAGDDPTPSSAPTSTAAAARSGPRDGEHAVSGSLGEAIVAMLSHELRTPVTAIYGGSQLLLHPDLPSELRNSVIADIADEAERLHRLIEDLLAIARTERGVRSPPDEPVLIQRLLLAVADHERRRRPWADVEVHADLDLPPVRATEDEVRQVLRNVLSNAIAAGGTSPVTVTATLQGDEVVTSVIDRGPGLAAAAGADAFRLYHRSPAIARHVPGTGLELFVARAIVESLGGRIWVEPGPGGGSVVSLALARFDEPDRPAETGGPARPRRAQEPRQPPRSVGVAGRARGAA